MPPRAQSLRHAAATQNNNEAGPSGTQQPSQEQATQVTEATDYVRFTVLQHLMLHGSVKEFSAKDLFFSLTGSNDDVAWKDMVATINAGIRIAGLEIRTLHYPVDQEEYVGLVNMHSDMPSKLGSMYTPQQLNYYKQAVEAIATKELPAVAGMPTASFIKLVNLDVHGSDVMGGAATQQATARQRMGIAQMEATLMLLIKHGWLASAPPPAEPGHVTFGVRTLLELGRVHLMELEGVPEATLNAWDAML